jgi:hypothetical protein
MCVASAVGSGARAGTIEPAIPKLTADVLYEVWLSARGAVLAFLIYGPGVSQGG